MSACSQGTTKFPLADKATCSCSCTVPDEDEVDGDNTIIRTFLGGTLLLSRPIASAALPSYHIHASECSVAAPPADNNPADAENGIIATDPAKPASNTATQNAGDAHYADKDTVDKPMARPTANISRLTLLQLKRTSTLQNQPFEPI
ncbi:hypothetical protein L7F22_054933 [Adiantum nelumboides]|nr:hypothetical protein [Adiantum nelumboides]